MNLFQIKIILDIQLLNHEEQKWSYKYIMSNDSLSPFDTTFHHLTYVTRWSLILFYF
jgi:hypothetical protein